MKLLKKVFFISLILISACSFMGCEKQEETIVFDNQYPLALSPNVQWAVVKEPYAAYKNSFDWDAAVVGHCRRGEILFVLGQSIDSEGATWCHFENGWLPESCLVIYNNRLKAQRVSEAYEAEDEK